MNDQQPNTETAISEDRPTGDQGSILQAHLIGVAALAVAIGLSAMFDLAPETSRVLFLAAIIIYGQLYKESTKNKPED